jgi:hypothetical protein
VTTTAPPLASAQAALLRWIVALEGVARALADDGDPEGRALEALVRGDAELPALARVGVYAHAYFERIRKCLAGDFPALSRALGEAAFHDLVKLYLLACPPRHWSLRYAGDRLAEFAGRHPAAAAIRARCPFAGDVAALEYAIAQAFDAPDAAPLARDDLARLPAEAWAEHVLRAAPGLQRLELGWPVQRLREAHEGDAEPPALEPAATLLGVWRERERVFFRALHGEEADALAGLLAGEPFGALCERIERHVGAERTPVRAAQLLERWLADGWLRAP